jgi:hypothetical protein
MTDTANSDAPRRAEIERLRTILRNADIYRDVVREMVTELADARGIFSEVMGDDPDAADADAPEMRGPPPKPLPPLNPLGPFPPTPSTVPEPKAVIHPTPNVLSHPVFRRPKKPQDTP